MSVTAGLIILMALVALLYAAGIEWLAFGTRNVLRQRGSSSWRPLVSVIIAARDEETHIESCLTSVLVNDYPDFEVIVVDDGSTDATPGIIQSIASRSNGVGNQLKLVRSNPDGRGSGKVAALARGIEESLGEVLVTLDADCLVHPGWLQSMLCFMTPRVGFVAGPVAYTQTSRFLKSIEALEFLSLISVGAGAIGIGKPLICNSANAAYRRELYQQMSDSLPPTDFAAADELLMHFVHENTPYGVAFCSSPEALVTTDGADSISGFFLQRMRWVSMVGYLPAGYRFALTAAFLFFILVFAYLLSGFWNTNLAAAAFAALAVKSIVDYRAVAPVCRHFGFGRLLRVFLPAELLYIPYVLVTAPLGTLIPTKWKGRATPCQSRSAPASASDPHTQNEK